MTSSDQTDKPRSRKTGGRLKGTPNKVTSTLREAVANLLEANRENMGRWLDQVANGTPAKLHEDGTITPGRPPDPARALEIIAKLAEYAAPKLSRTEFASGGDEQVAHNSPIVIEFVNAPPARLLSCPTTARVGETSIDQIQHREFKR